MSDRLMSVAKDSKPLPSLQPPGAKKQFQAKVDNQGLVIPGVVPGSKLQLYSKELSGLVSAVL